MYLQWVVVEEVQEEEGEVRGGRAGGGGGGGGAISSVTHRDGRRCGGGGAATRGPRQSDAGGEKVTEGREKVQDSQPEEVRATAATSSKEQNSVHCTQCARLVYFTTTTVCQARDTADWGGNTVGGGGATDQWRRRSGSRTG